MVVLSYNSFFLDKVIWYLQMNWELQMIDMYVDVKLVEMSHFVKMQLFSP